MNNLEFTKNKYSITELSEHLNITDHTLRYYEKEFDLFVPKDERGRRYYTPEIVNTIFQIKSMRNEGLVIKAIKNIIQSKNQTNKSFDDITNELPQLTINNSIENNSENNVILEKALLEINQFINNFKDILTANIVSEITSSKETVIKEINKSKLELSASFENKIRKLESKVDSGFENINILIGNYKIRKKPSLFSRFFNR